MALLAQLVGAQETLICGIQTIVDTIAKLTDCDALVAEATQTIRMLTDDSLVEIKLRFVQLCTVHLVCLVETMIDAIAAQKFGYALKGIRTGELKGRTLVQLLPAS